MSCNGETNDVDDRNQEATEDPEEKEESPILNEQEDHRGHTASGDIEVSPTVEVSPIF